VLRDVELSDGVLLLRHASFVRSTGRVESLARAFQMKQDAESIRHIMFRQALEEGEDPPPMFKPMDLKVRCSDLVIC
jgi:hypothetical protein